MKKYSMKRDGEFYIGFPDVESVTEKMFYSIETSQKEFPLNSGSSVFEATKRDAKLCALFVGEFGEWNLDKFSSAEFIAHIDSDEEKSVQLIAWVRNRWNEFVNEVLNPNVYAVS
jgi:hypothetical protein